MQGISWLSGEIFVSEEGLNSTELLFSYLVISNDDGKFTGSTFPYAFTKWYWYNHCYNYIFLPVV